MELEALKCPVCYNEYDQAEHCPRIIIECGDTLCTACLSKLVQNSKALQCPIDFKNLTGQYSHIENFPVNTALRLVIEERSKVELCRTHKEKLRLICLTDKCKVCDDCVHFGSHKGHKVKNMAEFKEEANEKHHKVRDSLDRLMKYRDGMELLLAEKRDLFITSIEGSFKTLRSVLDSKEFELLCQINTFFRREREKANLGLGTESNLYKEIVHTLEDQKENFKSQNYFAILEEDISSIISKLDISHLEKNLLEVSAGIKKLLDSIDHPLATQTKHFQQLHFPLKEVFERIHSTFLGDGRRKRGSVAKTAKNNHSIQFPSNFELNITSHLLQISAREQTDNLQAAKNNLTVINPRDLDKVERVEIKLANYEHIQEDIGALRYIFGKLENLSTLYIECDPRGISDNHLIQLLPIVLSKSEELEEFDINLSGCNGIGDSCISFLADTILSKMSSVKSFGLSLSSTGISDKSLRELAMGVFPHMRDLMILKVDLDKTRVSDEGVVLMFRSLKAIKSFSMQLNDTSITDLSLRAFTENTLRVMEYFELFNFSLDSTKVTDKGVIDLLIQMPNVKTFGLSLNSTSITDKIVDVFLQTTFSSLDSLQSFNISINDTKVSQQRREKIAEAAMEVAERGKMVAIEVIGFEQEDDPVKEET